VGCCARYWSEFCGKPEMKTAKWCGHEDPASLETAQGPKGRMKNHFFQMHILWGTMIIDLFFGASLIP